MSSLRFAIAALLLAAPCSSEAVLRPELGGEGEPSLSLHGDLAVDDGKPRSRLEFSCDIQPTPFRLNSVNGKYKLVLIRVRNWSTKVARLSRANDRIDFRDEGGGSPIVVHAALDPQKSDPAFWNALDARSREVLTYPDAIEAGAADASGVVTAPAAVTLCTLFPAEMLTNVPTSIELAVESLHATATMRNRRAKD